MYNTPIAVNVTAKNKSRVIPQRGNKMTTFEIEGITVKETVASVTKRESRRDKAGVQVCWQVAKSTKSFDIERDTEEEARSAVEAKFREHFNK